jgi:hypothetical protein
MTATAASFNERVQMMKKIFLTLMIVFAASTSFSATLNCWKTNFNNVKTPYLSARILSHTSLADIQFLYKTSKETSMSGAVNGTLINSNHSPYKGNVSYTLSNGDTLILPPNLSNGNLTSVEMSGIGYFKSENGVIIGSFRDGDAEGGSHFSERLSCRSDI